jgi:hypothetical protein
MKVGRRKLSTNNEKLLIRMPSCRDEKTQLKREEEYTLVIK